MNWLRDNAPLVISTSALFLAFLSFLWTVGTFWWMQWRKGRIQVGPPRSFAARGSSDEQLMLYLPLIFFNTGPTPRVIEDLRVVFLGGLDPTPLTYVARGEALPGSKPNQDRLFSTQFGIPGRQLVTGVFEFQRRPGKLLFEAKRYNLALEARLDGSETWSRLIAAFPLFVSAKYVPQINTVLVTYNNYPDAG